MSARIMSHPEPVILRLHTKSEPRKQQTNEKAVVSECKHAIVVEIIVGIGRNDRKRLKSRFAFHGGSCDVAVGPRNLAASRHGTPARVAAKNKHASSSSSSSLLEIFGSGKLVIIARQASKGKTQDQTAAIVLRLRRNGTVDFAAFTTT